MSENKAKLSRRNFLFVVGAGGAVGAAAIAAKTVSQVQPVSAGDVREGTRGYHASAHIRNYYRTAKL